MKIRLLAFVVLASAVAANADVLSDLFDRANSKVFSITSYDAQGAPLSRASGFVVDKKGIIVTNYSTVARAALIELKSPDETEEVRYASALLNHNEQWDVALLKTKRFKGKALELTSSKDAKPGMEVFAIGSPQGFNNTISQGNVEGLLNYAGRSDLIQITNVVDPGAVGGPVLTKEGKVLGVAKSVPRNRRPFHFAVPGQVVKELLDNAGGDPERDLVASTREVREMLAVLRNIRTEIERECTEDDVDIIDHVISNAIASGAGIYNAGHHMGCYRIYEGAGYKILYSLQNRCEKATSLLSSALTKASDTKDAGRYETVAAAQAWTMRHAFDALLGQRPDRVEPADPAEGPDLEEAE